MPQKPGPARVLICGGELPFIHGLQNRLNKLGHSVCGLAGDREETLVLAEMLQPDLIILNTAPPGVLNCVEIAEEIQRRVNIPAIFITSASEAYRLERDGVTTPYSCLVKTFDDRALETAISATTRLATVESDKRQLETELNQVFDCNPNLLCIANSSGYLTKANPAFERTLKYTESYLLSRPFREFIHPDDREFSQEMFLLPPDNGASQKPIVNRVICRDGSVKWLEWTATRISGDGRSLAAARDITDHILADKALRESQERFSFLIKNSSDILVIINENGRQEYVSSAAERITGYSSEELVQKSLSDIIHPDDMPIISKFWDEAAAHPERIVRLQYRHIHKTRGWVHLEALAQNCFEESSVRGIVASVRDITERMQAEADKENLQSQLLQAQKMEAIGALAGGVAHDFNNLLQAINGYTQLLLLKKNENEPDYQNLKAIQDAGFRASELVRQLLLFSRKEEMERKPLEIKYEIDQAVRMLERTIPKMIKIKTRMNGRPWAIMADPIQIEQIILNLGANAADAMPDGGELLIETQNANLENDSAPAYLGISPGRYVLVRVSDTGVGMDEETQAKIFEPFFTTKAFGKGTGLGLASVYGIIKNHGGHIKCYSEVGQGTSFNIYLPAVEQVDKKDPETAKPEPARGFGETILLVDDDRPVRETARLTLLEFGYSVVTASTGEEALGIYSSRLDEINLVILDLGMPGMGGRRCLKELLKINPEIKVILVSGYSEHGQAKKALDDGAVGYIGKPYHLTDLLSAVRNVLDQTVRTTPTNRFFT